MKISKCNIYTFFLLLIEIVFFFSEICLFKCWFVCDLCLIKPIHKCYFMVMKIYTNNNALINN